MKHVHKNPVVGEVDLVVEEDFLADGVAEEEGVETTSWLNTHDEEKVLRLKVVAAINGWRLTSLRWHRSRKLKNCSMGSTHLKS